MIPIEYQITDTRDTKELAKISFSGYQIKDVVQALSKSMINCKIEEAVNWSVELLLSGQTEKYWEKVFSIALKNINTNNPKLPNFLFKRYSRFVSLKLKYSGSAKSTNVAGFLSLRNSQIIRNMICEVCVTICNSTKLKPITLPKIKDADFNSEFIKTKIVANNSNIVTDKLKYGDPEELRIPLNEFNFCIKTRKWELAVYWLAWIIEWERRNTKRDKFYICGFRKIDGIEEKLCTDVIWIIWEILIKEVGYLNDDKASKQVFSLYKLYKFDFKPAKKSKRVFFILYAIKYFTEIYSFKQEIIPNYYQLIQACSNINIMFYDKKKYEVNKHKSNVEKAAHHNIVNNVSNEKQTKLQKEELKRLKKIADIKIKNKISAVEQIDTLILSKKK
jgi:hypothetical protein